MTKRQLLLFAFVFGMANIMQSQISTTYENVNHHYIDLSSNQTAKQRFELLSKQYSVTPANLNISVSYDISQKELTMVIEPTLGIYHCLWLPKDGYYSKKNIRRLVKSKRHAVTRFPKQFKKQIKQGMEGNNFVCSNCRQNEIEIGNLNEEFLDNRQTFTYHFYVIDPKKPVVITMNNPVLIQIGTTAFSETKYVFNYIADPVRIEILVPSDPCKLPSYINLYSELKALYDDVNKDLEYLQLAANKGSEKSFDYYKKKFEKEHKSKVEILENKINRLELPCELLDLKMKAIHEMIGEADKTKIVRKPPRDMTKQIKDRTEMLNFCIDAVRSGEDVGVNIEKGNDIIKEVDKIISRLTKDELSTKRIKDAIKAYEYTKKSFERIKRR